MSKSVKEFTEKEREEVLVMERENVFRVVEPFEGFLQDELATIRVLNEYAKYHHFKMRGDVEEDPSLKQLIPYVMIKRGREYLSYRRLAGGGEQRLHGKRSLGFGGHMNEVVEVVNAGTKEMRIHQVSFRHKLMDNLWREISKEELDFSFKQEDCTLTFLGLVNDDADPTGVGAVHLGLVAILDIPSNGEVDVKETDAHAIEFLTRDAILAARVEYENWSQFLVDTL